MGACATACPLIATTEMAGDIDEFLLLCSLCEWNIGDQKSGGPILERVYDSSMKAMHVRISCQKTIARCEIDSSQVTAGENGVKKTRCVCVYDFLVSVMVLFSLSGRHGSAWQPSHMTITIYMR